MIGFQDELSPRDVRTARRARVRRLRAAQAERDPEE
jgi:hypothetical protein